MSILDRLKSWYTLSEAADRLSRNLGQKITEHDVVQLAGEGHIVVCWYLTGEQRAFPATVSCDYPQGGETFLRVLPEVDANGASWRQSIFGPFRLPIDFYPPWGWFLLKFIGKGGDSGTGWDPILIDPTDGRYWGIDELNGDFDKFPEQNELVIQREELEAFEHACQQPTITHSPTAAVGVESDSERVRLLKHIGALALVVAEKSAKYKKGDQPNVSQISQAAVDMLELLPDVNARGAGISNLRKSVAEGLELLKK